VTDAAIDSPGTGGVGGSAGGAGGAGGTGGGGGSTATSIAISGVASPFQGDPETDFTSLALAIADPLQVLANPKAALATMAPFDTSGAICPDAGTTGCVVPYTFPAVSVDPSKSTLGLLAIFQDLRPSASDGGVAAKWVRTGTGIANTAQLAAAVATGSLPGRPAYAVSTKFEALLSKFAATVTTGANGVTDTAGSLSSRGFVLALILANGTPKPTPVVGATFGPKPAANADKSFTVLYPNADFTGVGTSTSASGLVLIFPNSPPPAAAPVAPWVVTPPSTSTATWPEQIVGVQANGAVVLLDVSN